MARQSFRRVTAAIAAAALALAFNVSGLGGVAHAQANGSAAPSGSYLQSCKNISMKGKVVHAQCRLITSGGSEKYSDDSQLDTTNCQPNNDIVNDSGTLYCMAIPGKAGGGAVPGGSYLQSCHFPNVGPNNVLTASCDDGSGNWPYIHLQLNQCDPTKPVANIRAQLVCAPGTGGKVGSSAQAMTLGANPAQTKLKAAGCSLFLGRPTEFLCRDDAAFAQCKSMMPSPEVTVCNAPGQLTTQCQHFLGRADEYLCLTEGAYKQCESFLKAGKAKACHAKGH